MADGDEVTQYSILGITSVTISTTHALFKRRVENVAGGLQNHPASCYKGEFVLGAYYGSPSYKNEILSIFSSKNNLPNFLFLVQPNSSQVLGEFL